MYSRPLYLLTIAAFTSTAFASTFTQVSSTAGSSVCSNMGTTIANCSQTVGSEVANASATANITPVTGLFDVVVNVGNLGGVGTAFGNAFASFNQFLVVTGGAGSGILTANFHGFDDVFATGTLPALPVLSLSLGAVSSNVTPPLIPGSFSISAPFTFGSILPFTGSISAFAQAPQLNRGNPSSAGSEGKVFFDGFTLKNVNGAPLAGTVMFTPEPSFTALLGLVLAGTAGFRLRKRC